MQVPLRRMILVHHTGNVVDHGLLLYCVLDICHFAQKCQVETVTSLLREEES